MPSREEDWNKLLPVLPGYSHGQHRTSHHKSHFCDFADGVATVRKEIRKPPTKAEVESEISPPWKVHDKQVLRFYGSYKDSTTNSDFAPIDQTHNVVVLFYLEDNSLQVLEPHGEHGSSGNGTLVSRHRALISVGGVQRQATIQDMNVGKTITLYAKDISLKACDVFTRNFLNENGVQVPSDAPIPHAAEKALHPKKAPSFVVPHTSNKSFIKFFEHDGHVLRFFGVWRDSAGDLQHLILHYFLADDTIEIRLQVGESRTSNVPFLRRHRVPKNVISFSMDGSNLAAQPDSTFYNVKDFVLGNSIDVYGKQIALCECDVSTVMYFESKNIPCHPVNVAEFAGINAATGEVLTKEVEPACHSYRSDIAELESNLPGSAAAKEPRKKGVDDKIVLRFSADMNTKDTLDKQRNFVISYFYVDNTFSVYEKYLINSGLPGGKYLERTQIKKPDGRSNYNSEDLALGAEFLIYGRKFALKALDSFTRHHVDQYPDVFPNLQ